MWKCFFEFHRGADLFIAMNALKSLVNELGSVHSVDGFLTKLTTFVLRLEDLFGEHRSARRVFEKVLACEELELFLRVLAGYRDVVEVMVFRDLRFKPLRSYADILLKTLNSIESTEETLSITRPPLNTIERGYPSTTSRTIRIGPGNVRYYRFEAISEKPPESGKPIKVKTKSRARHLLKGFASFLEVGS